MDRRELLALLAGAGLTGWACRGDRGNPTVQAARTGRPYQFKALTPHQAATVTVLVDCIIPATGTPGAAEAGVPQFIDVIVGEWYTWKERAYFMWGLSKLDWRSITTEGRRFLELSHEQQVAILEQMDAEAFADLKANPLGRTPFWLRLKSLTVYGYYNSAVGSLQELDRPIIPGRFDGCDHLPAARPGAL